MTGANAPAADPDAARPGQDDRSPAAIGFELFGGVRAVHGGHPVEIGRRQERCMLGLLLIESGRAVPADRLADLLWDGQPPDGVRRVLQTYAARVRRVLAPYGVPVVADSGGYRVDVALDRVDLHRFRARVAAAAELAVASARASALAEALAVWRGPVLGDTASELLRARVTATYEDMRLTAAERCAQAEIECGRPDRAVLALDLPVAARPVREGAVELLMAALAAAGRRAEALAAYRTARATIVADLGLEPGPALQAAHAQILAGRLVQPRSHQPADPRPTGPAELPPVSAMFTGRVEEQRRLASVLTGAGAGGRARVAVVHGRGGAGKSALAVQVAHRVSGHFPDGQIYIDLCGSTPGMVARTAAEAVEQALRSLGVTGPDIPAHEAEAVARLRSLTSGRRLLFVLDNVAGADTVRPLVPAGGGCAVLVTSRAALGTVESDLSLDLPGLPDDAARQLLSRASGRADDRRGTYDRIAVACERLPLALRIAAARLATEVGLSPAELADRLEDQRRRLDELDVEGLAVRASVAVGVDALRRSADPVDRLAATLLPLLTAVPTLSTTSHLMAAAAGTKKVAGVRTALDRLVGSHLLFRLDSDRYGVHDLVRLWATEQDVEADATDRVHRYYLVTAMAVHAALLPGREPTGGAYPAQEDLAEEPVPDTAAANRWLTAELPNLLAAARAATDLFPLRLARAVQWLLGKRSDWAYEIALATAALDAADRGGDVSVQVDALRLRGQADLHVDRLDSADDLLSRAAKLAASAGDTDREMKIVADLARVALMRQDLNLAEERLLRCLDYAPDDHGRAVVLLNLSTVYVDQRRFDDADRALRESLDIRRATGDLAGLAIVLPAIGYVTLERGDRDGALAFLDEAVPACRRAGNELDGWFALAARSAVHLMRREGRPALRDAVAAMRLCNDGRPHWAAATWRLIALAARETGRTTIADALASRADEADAAVHGPREWTIDSVVAHATEAVAGPAGH